MGAPVEIVEGDAAEYQIPDSPVVAFFFSPFFGELLSRVLGNITSSWNANPRPMYIIFYGNNRESIEMLHQTGFACEELDLSVEWLRLTQYRCFVLSSPDLASPSPRS
jgi:hypothetical protein